MQEEIPRACHGEMSRINVVKHWRFPRVHSRIARTSRKIRMEILSPIKHNSSDIALAHRKIIRHLVCIECSHVAVTHICCVRPHG